MASRFHKSVKDLRNGLNQDGSRSEASQLLRTLVDKIVLTPKTGEHGLSIDLYGDLAGILNMGSEKKELAGSEMLMRLQLSPKPHKTKLVAGTHCQRYPACYSTPLI